MAKRKVDDIDFENATDLFVSIFPGVTVLEALLHAEDAAEPGGVVPGDGPMITLPHGLADDGLELFGRRPARIAQIDLVMPASEVVAALGHDLTVKHRQQRSFVVVAADVQGLQAETLLQAFQPQAFRQDAELLFATRRVRRSGPCGTGSGPCRAETG